MDYAKHGDLHINKVTKNHADRKRRKKQREKPPHFQSAYSA